MIKLPTNRTNTKERIENGVDKIMNYVCKQIEYCHNTNKNDDVVAIVKSGSEFSKCTCNGVKEEWFPNDIIEKAMQEVKNQGYYVWHNSDYMGNHSYWITETTNRPHVWYCMF